MAPLAVNPATGDTLPGPSLLSPEGLERALAQAHEASEAYRRVPVSERTAGLVRLAEALEADKEAHAQRMVREMGKPIAQARAEIDKCALVCRYYAEHGPAFVADSSRPSPAARSLVAYEPLGPVLAIMPWNFPYWQVFRFAAPALLAGNVGLLKHAPNTFGCGEAIAGLIREAGFAEGVFQHLPIKVEAVEGIIADPRVRAVTLTGSERAGRAVGAQAGQALKPCVLELGGSDAFVVLADADLDRAVEVGVRARTQNNGQSCIAAKRFILERPIAEAFTERFVQAMEALRVGDPTDEASDLGPLAREDLRESVHDQVERALKGGAEVLTGGTLPEGPGYYYPPTVLGGVGEGSVAFEEEIFGPVAALVVAQDEADALRLANATRFGLGGSVWTQDSARGERFAREMQAGMAFVNEMVQSHPAVPFGGVGDSGFGRELGAEGLRAFVNAKTIWVGG